MRGIILIFCFFFSAKVLCAQPPCSDQSILEMKGSWNKRSDANMKGRKDQAAIDQRLDKISEIFKTAYPEPKGIEPNWYRSMNGNPLVNNGPIPYNFNSLYLSWYCNQNLKKIMLGSETGTWAYVFVNNFGLFLSDQYDRIQINVNENIVFLLPQKKGEWKGYPLYESSSSSGKNHCILLTHTDQLPWKPVTQKQYLDAIRLQWIEHRSKRGNAASLTKYWDDKIALLDNYLKQSEPATLQNPAIVNRNMAGDFKGQFSTEQTGGRMLVTINPGYFNSKLPVYVPQLMVLLWRWDNSASAQDFKKTFEDNFSLEKLKDMLDK